MARKVDHDKISKSAKRQVESGAEDNRQKLKAKVARDEAKVRAGWKKPK